MGKSNSDNQLDARAMEILDWTGFSALLVRTASWFSLNLAPKAWSAVSICPRFEAFVLFVAHHVNAYISKHAAAGHLKPEDCRLILPIAKEDEDTDAEYARYANDSNDLARAMCSMFPFGTSVARQAAPAPHLVVTNAAIASGPNEFAQAVRNMAKNVRALYYTQHNRRFAWGLAVSCRTVCAYVFGTDAIWPSSDTDVLHAAFGKNSKFNDKLPQIVSTRPVYAYKGDRLVEDTTATAFATLPTISRVATAANSRNAQQRDAFVANPPKALAIKCWNTGSANNIALTKRNHMSSLDTFMTNVADAMHHGLLRNLAADLYEAVSSPGVFWCLCEG
ncbi:hypothetical protein GGI20_003750 [Coemansia sp. BCRC 34301]|nr:hypothetical protein GGI20_003750 [Coemansia sp. BCRC 34301]